MEIKFLGSFEKLHQLPGHGLPEFAFIGRSNVGKSSFINTLTNHKNLAHTSSTPGKTQLMNLFQIDQKMVIVDLPGYGYAKLGKKQRQKLASIIKNYLADQPSLFLVFLLLDIRVEPQKNDMDMLTWLGEKEVPVHLIFTKTDKLKPREISASLDKYKEAIEENWTEMPIHFLTSSFSGEGRDEVWAYIDKLLISSSES
jgi:GTP-binding protein